MAYQFPYFTKIEIHSSPGSVNIHFVVVVPVKVVLIPISRAEVEEIATKVMEIIKPVLTEIVTKVKDTSDAPGFLKQIDVTKPVVVQPIPG